MARTEFVKAGTRVLRRPHKSAPGKGMSYGSASGVMLEEGRIGPEAGWDVYDVQIDGGDTESAYGFDLVRAPSRRTSTKRKSTSRSKPKRAKKRTVTRLRRVRMVAGRRGYGVMKTAPKLKIDDWANLRQMEHDALMFREQEARAQSAGNSHAALIAKSKAVALEDGARHLKRYLK